MFELQTITIKTQYLPEGYYIASNYQKENTIIRVEVYEDAPLMEGLERIKKNKYFSDRGAIVEGMIKDYTFISKIVL